MSRDVVFTACVRAFSTDGSIPPARRIAVDRTGTVRIYDAVAGHFTTVHDMNRGTIDRMRERALEIRFGEIGDDQIAALLEEMLDAGDDQGAYYCRIALDPKHYEIEQRGESHGVECRRKCLQMIYDARAMRNDEGHDDE